MTKKLLLFSAAAMAVLSLLVLLESGFHVKKKNQDQTG